jgi:hypothetical protein
MFTEIQGAHGSPDVIGSVNYPNILNVFTTLKDLRLCEDFKEVYSHLTKCPQPEHRALVRMICPTQGTSLMRVANKPKTMVKAILDAMIGRFLPRVMVNVLIDSL